MKILFFDDFKLGVVKGDAVVDVSSVVRGVPHTDPGNLISGLIARFGDYRGAIEKTVNEGKGVPLSSVRIRPPLPRPVNIDCMAVNYMEDGTRKEPAPINAFHKSPGCLIGDGDTMILPDRISGLIARFGDYRGAIEKTVNEGKGVPLSSVRIRPPLPRPVNIDCMAVNYMEDGTRKEPAPINAFHKSPGCLIGDGDTMIL